MGKKATRKNKRQEKTREICELWNIFSHISYSRCIISLLCICLVLGHCGNTKKRRKGQESNVNSLISPGECKNKAVNRRQDVFQLGSVFKQHKSVYQILGCSVCLFYSSFFFLYCMLAEHIQLCFCMKVSRPTDVRPSVSQPQVRSNSIRMARGDMSQNGDD